MHRIAGGEINMKIIRIMAAAMMAVLLTVAAISCKKEKDPSRRHSKTTGSNEITEPAEAKQDFHENKYYVMVGTTGEDDDDIRLRYFDGEDIKAVVWEHDPGDYEYGDVFVSKDGAEPVREINDDPDPGYMPPYELGSDIELEKIGSCDDLMDTMDLKVKSADYDGMGHWSIMLFDGDENEYYYGFMNDACFEVDLSGAAEGEEHTCAMNDGKIVIPLD